MPKVPLDEATAALARAEKMEAQERQFVVEWEKKAMLAVKAGNDDLAKQALLRMFEREALSIEAAASVEEARENLEELRAHPELRASAGTSPVAVPAAVSPQTGPRPDELQRRLRASQREEQIRAARNANLDAALRALKTKMGVPQSANDDDKDLDNSDDDFSVLGGFGKPKKNWPN
jgi:hypothetical protein